MRNIDKVLRDAPSQIAKALTESTTCIFKSCEDCQFYDSKGAYAACNNHKLYEWLLAEVEDNECKAEPDEDGLTYEDGLKVAWNLARHLFALSYEERKEIFGEAKASLPAIFSTDPEKVQMIVKTVEAHIIKCGDIVSTIAIDDAYSDPVKVLGIVVAIDSNENATVLKQDGITFRCRTTKLTKIEHVVSFDAAMSILKDTIKEQTDDQTRTCNRSI